MPRQAPQQPMDTNMMGGKPQKQAGFGSTPGPAAPKPMDVNPMGGAGGMRQKPLGSSDAGTSNVGLTPASMPGAVPSFNQRRANAQSLYGPGGSGWANFGLTGGMDQQTRPAAGPPQPTRPMQAGGPADISRPMGPPPVRPPQFGPPQMGDPFTPQAGPAAPPAGQADFLRQIFSNPGFMQMLQQYMSRQGQMGQRGGPVAGGLPPAGGMQQF